MGVGLGVPLLRCSNMLGLPIGSIVVPFGGSYLGSYKVIPNSSVKVIKRRGLYFSFGEALHFAFSCSRRKPSTDRRMHAVTLPP